MENFKSKASHVIRKMNWKAILHTILHSRHLSKFEAYYHESLFCKESEGMKETSFCISYMTIKTCLPNDLLKVFSKLEMSLSADLYIYLKYLKIIFFLPTIKSQFTVTSTFDECGKRYCMSRKNCQTSSSCHCFWLYKETISPITAYANMSSTTNSQIIAFNYDKKQINIQQYKMVSKTYNRGDFGRTGPRV